MSFFLALSLLFLSACNKPDSPATEVIPLGKNALHLPLLSEPYTFNPCAIAETDASSISQNLFSRLVKLNSKGDVIPDLASEWEWSDDGLSLTFKMSTGVKWHDGTSFSGADVKYTLDAIKAQGGLLKDNLVVLREVSLPDKSHVQLDFYYHDPYVLYTLANDAAAILPSHLYAEHDWLTAPAVFSPVGTGAYKFANKVDGESLTLEANAAYFEGAPVIPVLQYHVYRSADEARLAFEEGKLDVLDTGMSLSSVVKYIVNPEYTVTAIDDAARIYLTFNMRNPVFTTELRRAIAYGINREELFKTAMLGVGQISDSYIAPKFESFVSGVSTVPSYDPARATELLTSIGTRNAEGFYLRLTLKVYKAEPYPEIAAVIKRNLAEIGIDVTVVQVDFAEWEETVYSGGDFEMALVGGVQGPYPEAIVHRISSKGQLNFTGFSNENIDNLLNLCMQEKDLNKRIQYMKDVQFYMAEQLPLIPLAEWYSIVAMKKSITNPPSGSLEVSPGEWHKAAMK